MMKKSQEPVLRFPKYKGKWIETTLGDVATFSKGKGISKNDIDENGQTYCIRYGELYTNYNTVIDQPISRTSVNRNDLTLSKGGEVIVPASGEDAKDIATAAVVIRADIALGGDLNIIRSKNDGYFLASYLSGKKRLELASMAQGNSVVHLYAAQLKILAIHFPDIEEQRSIATFIRAVDEKIALLQKKKGLLEKYKNGCMQNIFSQKVRFKDDNGNPFPRWKEKALGVLCNIIKGQQLNRNHMIENGHYPVINGGVTASGYTDVANAEKNAITISEGGNSCGYVDWQKEAFWLGGHCYCIHPKNNSKIQKDYLFQNLKYDEVRIMRLRVGSGLPNIQKRDLEKHLVFMPDLKEQKKIADFLSAIDGKIALVAAELDKARTFKKGLLQQMFV